jgi:membrane protein implicated in regulation of membrane protease activity
MVISNDAVAATAGGAAILNPVWMEWLGPMWQGIIAILGALVLAAALWNKVLEIKKNKKDLEG